MTQQLLVSVTRRDIDLSRPGGTEQCPIERALERRGIDAIVTPFSAIFKHNPSHRAELPRAARQFVYDFDTEKRPVRPIRFPLEFS